MDYESFMSKDVLERRRIWLGLTDDEIVALLATHRRRWLALNGSRLTSDQRSVLEEDILFVENELAKVSTNPEFASHQKRLQVRIFELLPDGLIAELSLIPRN